MPKVKTSTRAELNPFALELLKLEHRAMKLGLSHTHRLLNDVVQTCGWEISRILEKDGLRKPSHKRRKK